MKKSRKGKGQDQRQECSFSCWLYPAPDCGLELEESETSSYKKIRFSVQLADGETVPLSRVQTAIESFLRQNFPESAGWNLRELELSLGSSWAEFADPQDPRVPVQKVVLTVGNTAAQPYYSGSERQALQELAKKIAEVLFGFCT